MTGSSSSSVKDESSSKLPPAEIVIAGGGIVGLVLALAIQKQLGVVPEIYEKTSEGSFQSEAGAGLGMYPNGLRVIRDISPDLLQAIRDAGYSYKTRRWERHDGTDIMSAEESILSGDQRELDSIGIRRSSLQKVLYRHALVLGIPITFQKPLAGAVERDDGLLEVVFQDGTSRMTQVLFGADGALGKSRSIVAGENEPRLKYTGVTCLMGLSSCRRDGIAFPSSDQDDFHAVFFPTAENEQCFQFHEPIPEKEADSLNWGNLSHEVSKLECRRIACKLRKEGWHEKYVQPLENVIQAVRVGFALLEPNLKSWVKGRVALVGDAAHPPVPYIGQGAQQGMEDAGVAVALLKIFCLDKDANFNPTNFEKAMKLYEDIRIKRSHQILDFSKSLGGMQARRATHSADEAQVADNILKGEVLMYGTLPIMLPGATHDYQNDVKRVTQEMDSPVVSAEAAIEALEYLLGAEWSNSHEPKARVVGLNKLLSGQSLSQSDELLTNAHELKTKWTETLIDWLVESLKEHLRRIVAHNEILKKNYTHLNHEEEILGDWASNNCPIVDEVCDSIHIPELDWQQVTVKQDPHRVVLPEIVVSQLREYVRAIADLYNDNPFHNFEHACNVTVSVSKFLSRMSAEKGATLALNDRTYGIAADPLTQFACVFAALLHDADHAGVPNTQLLKEHPRLAEFHQNRAVAEQHSVHLAFEILLDPKYKDLRYSIYSSDEEMKRFRQLIVNIVMATDICDKDLKEWRNNRWDTAFAEKKNEHDDGQGDHENVDLKATIGIEHLIQAADVSHTMQPWNVYRQWNERLFAEMYSAYEAGRSEKDPSEFWYMGEIGFFDFYIIPLAKRMKEVGVFGRTADECLAFAERNREEWRVNGPEAVEKMIQRIVGPL